VTGTLSREVTEGRVAHSYLFAGPRGTGKTSTARVLAKALNCPDRSSEGEPCGVCESCVAIADGSSLDVIELDAASHNSVEDIREMRVSVSTVAWGGGAKRVFILDEAHMLSKAAGNALLKTLEEPPEHVHFVLATTEPYKLLDTIRSRTQRFDFRQVPVEILVKELRRISDAEGYVSDDLALTTVARRAAGSVRDALSLLEQVAALGEQRVTVDGVNRALGLADAEAFSRLANTIIERDAKGALELVAELSSQGVDLRRFVAESISSLRGVFLAHYAPNLAEVADEPESTLETWRAMAKVLSPAEVLRAVDQLGEALVRLREGREERLMIELTLLRLTRPETGFDAQSIGVRLDKVEQTLRRMAREPRSVEAPAKTADTAHPGEPKLKAAEKREEPIVEEAAPESSAKQRMSEPPAEDPAPDSAPDEPTVLPQLDSLTIQEFEAIWPALVASVRDELGPRRLAMFREASPGHVEDSTVVLVIPEHLTFHLAQISSDPTVGRIVAERASELLGGTVRIVFRSAAAPTEETDEARAPNKDELEEGSSTTDPSALVEGLLGGQVIDDLP